MSSSVERVCASIDSVMRRQGAEIQSEITAFVARVLQRDKHGVDESAALVDLGFGSLDLLELAFAVERKFNVRLEADGFTSLLRRELNEDVRDDSEVSETSLEWLRQLIPEARAKLVPGVKAGEVRDLYTPRTLARMVAWKLSEEDGGAPSTGGRGPQPRGRRSA